MRKQWVIGMTCLALAVSAAGCAKKQAGNQEVTATEETKTLQVGCYVTGLNTFNDTDGNTKTAFRFLVENQDLANEDWTALFAGQEFVKTDKETVEVYSQYLSDQFRFVNAVLDGDVKVEDITYEAGEYQNDQWQEAGEDQYQAVGMINENGNLYLFNGSGNSVGRTGDKIFCTWLAGFTCNTIDETGTKPQIASAENFSVINASGDAIGLVNGAISEPELIANEYGVEVVIEATDDAAVNHAIEQEGMTLRHTGKDGTVTDLVLEEPVEPVDAVAGTNAESQAIPESDETVPEESDSNVAETAVEEAQ